MNLKNQRPVLIPQEFVAEIEENSKAKLMDIAWDMATMLAGMEDAPAIMARFREVEKVVQFHRNRDKREHGNWKDRLERAKP